MTPNSLSSSGRDACVFRRGRCEGRGLTERGAASKSGHLKRSEGARSVRAATESDWQGDPSPLLLMCGASAEATHTRARARAQRPSPLPEPVLIARCFGWNPRLATCNTPRPSVPPSSAGPPPPIPHSTSLDRSDSGDAAPRCSPSTSPTPPSTNSPSCACGSCGAVKGSLTDSCGALPGRPSSSPSPPPPV